MRLVDRRLIDMRLVDMRRDEVGIRVGRGRSGAVHGRDSNAAFARRATIAVPRDSHEVPCGLSYRGPPYRV